MITLTIPKDPYGDGGLFAKSRIRLKPGLTVLAGCNGYGKTTLLYCVKDRIAKSDIPYVQYDNMTDGGNTARQSALMRGDMSFLATGALSSEGENIMMNMGRSVALPIGKMIQKHPDAEKYFIFLDAVDSGLSIDHIDEVKSFLIDTVLKDNADKEIYILVSTNSYEFGTGEAMWFDPIQCMYVDINSYEEYKDFIKKSREIVNARYDKGDEE